jgi:hypothetical protein
MICFLKILLAFKSLLCFMDFFIFFLNIINLVNFEYQFDTWIFDFMTEIRSDNLIYSCF